MCQKKRKHVMLKRYHLFACVINYTSFVSRSFPCEIPQKNLWFQHRCICVQESISPKANHAVWMLISISVFTKKKLNSCIVPYAFEICVYARESARAFRFYNNYITQNSRNLGFETCCISSYSTYALFSPSLSFISFSNNHTFYFESPHSRSALRVVSGSSRWIIIIVRLH